MKTAKTWLGVIAIALLFAGCGEDEAKNDSWPAPAQSGETVSSLAAGHADLAAMTPCAFANNVGKNGTVRWGTIKQIVTAALDSGNFSWAEIDWEKSNVSSDWLVVKGGVVKDEGQSTELNFAVRTGDRLVWFAGDEKVDPTYDAIKPSTTALGVEASDGGLLLPLGKLQADDVDPFWDLVEDGAAGADALEECPLSFE